MVGSLGVVGLWRFARALLCVALLSVVVIAADSVISPVAVGAQTCIDDAFEDNDDQASAASIPANGLALATVCADDDDWFEFRVFAGEVIAVDVFFIHEVGDIDVQLFDPTGEARAGSAGAADGEVFSFAADVDGDWAVRVHGFRGAQNDYDLRLSVGSDVPGPCTDDEFEENDFLVSASPVSANGSVSGQICLADPDIFEFPADVGDGIGVQLDFVHDVGDLDLVLVDPDGFERDLSDGIRNGEAVSAVADVAGLWQVVVYGFLGAQNSYELNVATSASGLCAGRAVTVDLSLGQVPTNGDDVIRGTSGPDVINALGGNDTICGLQGNDVIDAGEGFDQVFAAAGNDRIDGGVGNDLLVGGPGVDEINGGNGNDRIRGGDGADRLNGGSGLDRLAGGNGNDVIAGGSSDDELFGNLGRDRLFGGAGNDVLRGGAWLDVMDGGAGNNDGCTLTDPGGLTETRIGCEGGVFGR